MWIDTRIKRGGAPRNFRTNRRPFGPLKGRAAGDDGDMAGVSSSGSLSSYSYVAFASMGTLSGETLEEEENEGGSGAVRGTKRRRRASLRDELGRRGRGDGGMRRSFPRAA